MTELETTQSAPTTAAGKIKLTLREISQPEPDAGAMELTLATVAAGVEQGLAEQLEEKQLTGELDEFMLALTRFLAMHRSDRARQLIVVELPRHELPPGTRLHLLDEAIEAAGKATSPL